MMSRLAVRASPSAGAESEQPVSWQDLRRLEALAAYGVLDTPAEPAFDEIAALAASICGTPMAAITVLSDERQWFKSELGIGVRETPLDISFCAHLLDAQELVVPNARQDMRFAGNPLVTGAPYVRFYAGTPLMNPEGVVIGALCVMDRRKRSGLRELQREALRVLARQVVAQLELRKAMTDPIPSILDAPPRPTLPNFRSDLPLRDGGFEATAGDMLRQESSAALALLDLEQMKQISAILGNRADEAMLAGFGERLSTIVRSTDIVAQLASDKFAVLLPGIEQEEEARELTDALLQRLHDPFPFAGRGVECRASVGVAVYPRHGDSLDELARKAGIALERSKARGRGAVEVFRPEMLAELQRHLSMLSLARTAVARDWIEPHYQPKVDLRTGRVEGFEALLRWRGVGAGLHLPGTIGAAFEDPELATEIGTMMAERVVADMRRWLDHGIVFGGIAINASPAEFRRGGLADRLLATLSRASVPPELLELEVTETVLLGQDIAEVEHALRTLRGAGVRIALDDFGTGYASLSHLKQYPVSTLKLDRSFVRGVGCNADDAAIVRAVLALGQNLGIRTVAEGVETITQRDFLRRHGCELGQGFLFGAALSRSQVPERLKLWDPV